MNMYVGNLSYNVKEVDLREVMEEYGTVGSVKLIIDRDTRRSKGFAFVEMPETSEASNAIKQLNGAEYAGRPMVVKEAALFLSPYKCRKILFLCLSSFNEYCLHTPATTL